MNSILNKPITQGLNKEKTLSFNTKSKTISDLNLSDDNLDERIHSNEVAAASISKQTPLSSQQWQNIVGIKPTNVVETSTNTNKTAFNAIVKENFGISSSNLEQKARENLKKLTAKANALAKKINPNSSSWQETLTGLNNKRFKTPNEALDNYKETSAKTLEYMRAKGWIPKNTKPVEVVEDKNSITSGAFVSRQDGKFYVETADKQADIYLPFTAKMASIHELVHSADYQKNGVSQNPLVEGLAYHIEEQAYKEGDYYKTDAEKLQALKWQIIRNARVVKTAELQNGKTTPEAAIQFLKDEIKVPAGQAKAEVEGMLSDPLNKISYVGGSEGIEALWQQVKVKTPEMTYSQFLDKLYQQGENDTGTIAGIAKKEFGITLK